MRIWVYGCSFTRGYEAISGPYTWPYLIKLPIQTSIRENSFGGGGWYSIQNALLDDLPSILKDDLVIIQIPFANRIEIPYFVNDWSSYITLHNRHPKQTVGWLQYLKEYDELVEVLEIEVRRIFKLLNDLGLRFAWWSADRLPTILKDVSITDKLLYLDSSQSYMEWIRANPKYWYSDTDMHQNLEGHRYIAKLFSSQLSNMLGLTRYII